MVDSNATFCQGFTCKRVLEPVQIAYSVAPGIIISLLLGFGSFDNVIYIAGWMLDSNATFCQTYAITTAAKGGHFIDSFYIWEIAGLGLEKVLQFVKRFILSFKRFNLFLQINGFIEIVLMADFLYYHSMYSKPKGIACKRKGEFDPITM